VKFGKFQIFVLNVSDPFLHLKCFIWFISLRQCIGFIKTVKVHTYVDRDRLNWTLNVKIMKFVRF
jgi:hypothetical protein